MRCMICGNEVITTKEYTLYRDRWVINGAVTAIGSRINIAGHKECCENVENLIIFPNRTRIIELVEKLKKQSS